MNISSEVASRLKMLLKEDELVYKYVEEHGETINISAIKKVKQEYEALQNLGKADPVPTNGDDPIYEQVQECPVCGNQVIGYLMKGKSQLIEEDIFLIPHYNRVGNYFAVDYNFIQTTVCPRCFFASPDPKDFSIFNKFSGSTTKSQLSPNTFLISKMRKSQESREAILMGVAEQERSFKRPRSPQAAITAIKLSINRAEHERDSEMPNSYYKIGSYYLKIASIEEEAGINNHNSLELAADNFEKVITLSNSPKIEIEVTALYLLVASRLKLRKNDEAGAFIKFFKKSKDEVEKLLAQDPELKENIRLQKVVDQWEKKAQTLWEYRDDEEYWQGV